LNSLTFFFVRQNTERKCRGLAPGFALLCLVAASAAAQWLDAPEPDGPRTENGEIDLEAPPPRLPNGRVDLQGIWMPDDNRYIRDLALDVGDDKVPYQPWARRLFDERKDGAHSREDPDAHCLPQGIPKLGWVSYPWKLIETPNSIAILHETFTFWRQIFTDGRKVDPNATPTWMGYSTGRWEGDTFVVETTGFNGKAWLDQLGRPTTDELRVTERFTRTHFGHLRIDVTIDDPGAYTAPWSASQVVHFRPGWEPLEFICLENNKDIENLPGEAYVLTNIEAARRKGYLD
jgi:hypothetical protein